MRVVAVEDDVLEPLLITLMAGGVWGVKGFYETTWARAVLTVIACYIGWAMFVLVALVGSALAASLIAG